MFGEAPKQFALTARRLRRRKSQHRTRWLCLLASGTLIVGFSTCLVLCFSGQSDAETLVVDDFMAASHWNPSDPSRSLTQGKAAQGKAFPKRWAKNDAVYFWPLCLVGLLTSGGWFAYTVAYWRGNADWRVKWN